MTDRIPAHGTPGRYQGPRRHNRWQACRCDDCRAAGRRTAKAQGLRRLRGVPSYVGRETVAAHVRTLLDAGWTRVQIADTAQVGRKTVWNVLNSSLATVQTGTAQALLALEPADAPDFKPALGATRRVRALSAMGWTLAWTARQTGLSETALRDISSGRNKTIRREHFETLDRVYRRFAVRLGPSEAAMKTARAKQWVTAAAWNDIDDPKDKPHSVLGQCHRQRKAA
ncbi:hypothetical protein [Streptomyces sp. NPDC050564]|uniref:hypothetical protein n=1 Tax=Streptomyces sp. NPDC050564 TaxID=3365631 RepID=UPI00379B8087